MKSKPLVSGLASLAFAIIGICWASISPIGSSADDDFHLTSIWCANGTSKQCQLSENGLYATVPIEIGSPPCPVDAWSTLRLSETCIKEAGITESTLVTTNFNSNGTRPSYYYKIAGVLVTDDVQSSAFKIRILNVLLASALLFIALTFTPRVISRAVGLSWGLAIVPIGIFYIASANSSSWVITGVGLYWAFLSSILLRKNNNEFGTWILVLGLGISATMALASRSDSGMYLLIVSALLLSRYPEKLIQSKIVSIAMIFVLFILGIFSAFLLQKRFNFSNLQFPGANTEMDWPNPLLNALIEFPHYFVAFFGGQTPTYTMRGTTFSTGIGWLEYSLPSATGYLISMSVVAAILITMRWQFRRTMLLNAMGWVTLICLILMTLSTSAFDPVAAIQPRYFFPLTLALIGISLIVDFPRARVLTSGQAILMTLMVSVGSLLAWLRASSFYESGSAASYTNFRSEYFWWRDGIPERAHLFLLLMCATLMFGRFMLAYEFQRPRDKMF